MNQPPPWDPHGQQPYPGEQYGPSGAQPPQDPRQPPPGWYPDPAVARSSAGGTEPSGRCTRARPGNRSPAPHRSRQRHQRSRDQGYSRPSRTPSRDAAATRGTRSSAWASWSPASSPSSSSPISPGRTVRVRPPRRRPARSLPAMRQRVRQPAPRPARQPWPRPRRPSSAPCTTNSCIATEMDQSLTGGIDQADARGRASGPLITAADIPLPVKPPERMPPFRRRRGPLANP